MPGLGFAAALKIIDATLDFTNAHSSGAIKMKVTIGAGVDGIFGSAFQNCK
jgi:hypothetical protein